ncbi:paraquat-inducible protein A [Pedobacter sandarakinus]|uniref:paraquat-inducible protein A n=1 Tax=Pedobacter sandarakinus TaxID=353156 RepID=UPI002246B131|nr:paraquat-inducible protein A [Pedobacter sandarakinus]MCX2573635.1 paraquat-inducible protein A [Pedobacter sandarakinus]
MASNLTPHTSSKQRNFAAIALVLCLSVLLIGAAYFGHQFYKLSVEQKQIKEDYSLSNNVTFGIFSVDRWGEKISAVVDRRVKGFNLTAKQKAEMKQQVEAELHGLVNKAVSEITKPQKGLGGKLKKLAFNTFVDVDELHAQVPSFAKTIVVKITSPTSLAKIKGIATTKVNELEEQTYDHTDTTITTVESNIYKKYQVKNAAGLDAVVKTRLAQIKQNSYQSVLIMLGCVAVALLLWLFIRKKTHLHTPLFVMSLLFASVLLLVGVSAPIIEVDARIQSLHFALMGDELVFNNQVLFFQSKSILGIIFTLIEQPKLDAVLVGILLLLFVVILPLLRIIARALHVSCAQLFGSQKVLRFLAFDLGKWDMADVMVVGIAMTYIGLNGILKSQLSGLNIKNETLETVTVNNSALQLGFFVFLIYVVYAKILSFLLRRMDERNGPCT